MIRKKLKSKVRLASHAIPMATAACFCIYATLAIKTVKSILKMQTHPVDM